MTLQKMNSIAKSISVERLAEAVAYDPATGMFQWLERPEKHFRSASAHAGWNKKYAGKHAFTSACPRGYLRGVLDGKALYAHRAALALTQGEWPDDQVDHINRNKSDNRAENLRVTCHSGNRLNTADVDAAAERQAAKAARSAQMRAAYPIPGVRRLSKTTWSVRAKVDGSEKYLGAFRCFGRAVKARSAAT